MAGHVPANLVVSIDLELSSHHGSLAHLRMLDDLTHRMLELCQRLEVPATFGVADPRHSAATELITASRLGHEVAILGDAGWMGAGSQPQPFARELERRLNTARAAGHTLHSLLLRHVELQGAEETLDRNHIWAVRSELKLGRSGQPMQPEMQKHGLWQTPATLRLPHAGGWWFHTAASLARRQLQRAAGQGSVVHLAVDAGALVAAEALDLHDFERILTYAVKCRDAGQLRILTLGQLAARLGRPKSAAPLRSILRPAA